MEIRSLESLNFNKKVIPLIDRCQSHDKVVLGMASEWQAPVQQKYQKLHQVWHINKEPTVSL